MARAGLEPEWGCLFANDVDPRKGAAYAANWGCEQLRIADVASLRAADFPGRADLAWASFPCQDLSLAGAGRRTRRRPLRSLLGLLLGYALFDGATTRAPPDRARERRRRAHLQGRGGFRRDLRGASRPRLSIRGADDRRGAFSAAVASARIHSSQSAAAIRRRPGWSVRGPPPHHASTALQRAAAALPPQLAADWVWWRVPAPPRANLRLADCLDGEPDEIRWHSVQQTERLLAALSPPRAADVELAALAARVGACFAGPAR